MHGPSLDTCIEVLRDNELEEIYGDEFVKAVESWLREKRKIVVDMKPSSTTLQSR